MTSTLDALTGRWATNVPGWAAAAVLASVVVVSQEIVTPLPAAWIVVTVVLQLAAVTAWTALFSLVSRRRGRLHPGALGVLWVGAGVLRGVVGALVAGAAGADPGWEYRIPFWTVVSVFWMPLLTYALAQWETHRRLLTERAALAVGMDAAVARASEHADARERRLAAALDDALGPAVDEVRDALRAGGSGIDAVSARAISERLEAVAARAASFRVAPVVAPPLRSGPLVSVDVASREFELRRPVFAAVLAGAFATPLVLPEAYREGGWGSFAEMAVALLASTLVLIGAFGILRPRRFTGAQRSLLSRVGVIGAGLVGTVVLATLWWHPFEFRDVLMMAVYPVVFALAASTTATAVALRATNVDLTDRTRADLAVLDQLEERAADAEADAAARLEMLVRGDLNGKLASSAMALGFLANGDVPDEARADVVRGVLAQLDAAADELHAR